MCYFYLFFKGIVFQNGKLFSFHERKSFPFRTILFVIKIIQHSDLHNNQGMKNKLNNGKDIGFCFFFRTFANNNPHVER